MLNYIYQVLQKTCLTKDIIISIINQLFKHKWNIITRKIKIRINALSFNVISILSIYDLILPKSIEKKYKKSYYIKHSKPLLPYSINIIEINENSYKVIIYEKNNVSNKYVTYFKNGGVIWDNHIPRHSIMYYTL